MRFVPMDLEQPSEQVLAECVNVVKALGEDDAVGMPAGGCGRREESVRSVNDAVRRATWEPRIPPPGVAFEDARANTAGLRPASGLAASGRTATVASAFLSIVNAQSTCDLASACERAGATPPDSSDALLSSRSAFREEVSQVSQATGFPES